MSEINCLHKRCGKSCRSELLDSSNLLTSCQKLSTQELQHVLLVTGMIRSLPRIFLSISAISGIHVRCEFLPLRSVGKDPTKQKERSSALSIGVLCHKMVLQRSGGSDPAVTCPRVDCVEFLCTPFAIRRRAGLRYGLPLPRRF